ncbi:hypothetical protein FI667_g8154, partial [Globisporangium splendens]
MAAGLHTRPVHGQVARHLSRLESASRCHSASHIGQENTEFLAHTSKSALQLRLVVPLLSERVAQVAVLSHARGDEGDPAAAIVDAPVGPAQAEQAQDRRDRDHRHVVVRVPGRQVSEADFAVPKTRPGFPDHRHLKNGGTIQTPISATSASLGNNNNNNNNTPSIATISRVLTRGLPLHARQQHNISSKVKHDLEFRHQMEKDLQHAMQDFYTTNLHSTNDPKHTHLHSPLALILPLHPARGKHTASPSSSWNALAGAVMTPPSSHTEKVSLHLKVSMLRTLLSEKRKAFQISAILTLPVFFCVRMLCLSAKSAANSEEWRSRRQQMRRMESRYNVLEELAAYQKFQAENSVFLLLHSVSEAEMLHVMHCAQQTASNTTSANDHGVSEYGARGSVVHFTDLPVHAPAPQLPLPTGSEPLAPPNSSPVVTPLRRSSTAKTRSLRSSLGNSIVELLEDDE